MKGDIANMNDLVSIIVPVYNSGRYVKECVLSVLAQTYHRWELLLIDDGSQDTTKDICMQLCEQDSRISLLYREHKGVSAARNVGIEHAKGKYLFFLDSDDAIHPALIETLYGLMEKSRAAVGTELSCHIENDRFPECPDGKPDVEYAQKSTYIENSEAIHTFIWQASEIALNSIGGKMVRRDVLKTVKFNERFSYGEDTLFIYQMLAAGADVIFFPCSWYYYRSHEKSASRKYSIESIQSKYQVWQCIRNYEMKYNRTANAIWCEKIILGRIARWYIESRHKRDKDIKKYVKNLADSERNLSIFSKVDWRTRLWVCSVVYYYPLYWMKDTLLQCLSVWKDVAKKEKVEKCENKRVNCKKSRVGILTFHCADNYGAMLQAYGLKNYLCGKGIKADIVRYEPFFMTGRHWWIPYLPVKEFLHYAGGGWVQNLRMGKGFFIRRRNMKLFREQFLVEKAQRKLYFLKQLETLPYPYYIVGSDQIWNPAITYGLRRAYFGAFSNKRKKKVVAYAASLGSEALPPEYNREFSRLLKYVDTVSVREREAVPYVQKLCKRSVTAVSDPTFLLDKEDWQCIENQPARERYILVYMTEENNNLIDYVKKLARQKGLVIIELRSIAGITDKEFIVDYTAGPAEFLGYIHKADYVVTNSLHGIVFSIIFQKRFMVFQHSELGARINNVLRIHGLEHRLYEKNGLSKIDIDAVINWESVKRCTEECVRASEEFLLKHVGK